MAFYLSVDSYYKFLVRLLQEREKTETRLKEQLQSDVLE